MMMMMMIVALLDKLAVLQYILSIKQSIHITTLLVYGEDELRRRLVAPGYDSWVKFEIRIEKKSLQLQRICQEAYQRFDKILNGHGIGLHDGNDFLWMTDLGGLILGAMVEKKVRSDVIQDVNLTWNSQSMDNMNHFYMDDFRVWCLFW